MKGNISLSLMKSLREAINEGLHSEEIADTIKDRISESAEANVYNWKPKVYERRRSRGGLSDTSLMSTSFGDMVLRVTPQTPINPIHINGATGEVSDEQYGIQEYSRALRKNRFSSWEVDWSDGTSDNLSGGMLPLLIEYGSGVDGLSYTYYDEDGNFDHPRPYIKKAADEIRSSGEAASLLKESLKNKGFKVS